MYSIGEDSVSAIWPIARTGEFPQWLEVSVEWLREHFHWAMGQTTLAQGIDFPAMLNLLADDKLPVRDEAERFRSAARWHRQQGVRSTAEEYGQLMQWIDWTLIPERDLINLVFEEDRAECRLVESSDNCLLAILT